MTKKTENTIKETKKKNKTTKSSKELKELKKLQEQNTTLENKVTELEENLKLEKEKALKAYAEMENFKKRKEQEKNDFCKFANESLIKELLVVLDSFEYALNHAKENENTEKLVEGFNLIKKQIEDILKKFEVNIIEAIGQIFDPNLHQAVQQEENKDVAENTVIKELQKGYKLHNRVIRPSMVVVAK